MKFHFESVIKEKAFWPFFNLSDEKVQRINSVINFLRMANYGLTTNEPNKQDLELYQEALNKYLNSHQSSPHFVITHDDGSYIFCIDYRRAKQAVKIDDKFYLLEEIQDSPSVNKVISNLNLINSSKPFFPKFRTYKKNGLTYLAREFISQTEINGITDNEKEEFINLCKSIGFAPDINPTNFIRSNGDIYYIDQDFVQWVVNSTKAEANELANEVRMQE
jgi:hypothetical protein